MLTAFQLAAMQAAYVRNLPDSCAITRRTPTADGMGGQTLAWSTVATVPCWVTAVPRLPHESVIGERVTAVTRWSLQLPAGTDVQAKDHLIVNGTTYEVLDPIPTSSYEVVRRATCIIVVS